MSFAVDYTMLFSTTVLAAVKYDRVVNKSSISVSEDCHGEQCQLTAKVHSWTV